MEQETTLTLGSLFDGSGGFPLGGLLAGITPVWASEIEPFPIRVTSKRLPFMKHYGDISTMDGGKIEPVDIITFGSPCTDMSVAGKRAGLDGHQSVLFYQAIRIIKEMRCATNGKYPRWICWENVPGAFSSNSGFDFQAVLEAVIGIVEPTAQVPMPEKNRWPYADLYMGDRWSIAYRTLDAQHWGVPQRRKRIYLVADFNGRCAGQVLFESEGMSGYSAEGFRAWQRATQGAASCAGATGIDGYNGCLTGAVSATLGVNCGMSSGRNGIVLNDQGGSRMDVSNEVTCTLRAEAHHPPCILDTPGQLYENHSQDTRYTGPMEIAPTVSHMFGTGGNNQPFIIKSDHVKAYGIGGYNSEGMLSPNPHSGCYEANTSRTLDCNGGNPGCNQGGIAVVDSYSIQGSLISRNCENGPQGNGINQNVSFTLNTVDRHAIYTITPCNYTQVIQDKAPTLLSRDYKDVTVVSEPSYGIGQDTLSQSSTAKFGPTFNKELSPTLVAKGPCATLSEYTVRRLTPIECARLQGFPDWWCAGLGTLSPTDDEITYWTNVFETHRQVCGVTTRPKSHNQIIKWLRDPHSDAAEYKMWGNGVALPCVFFVLSGIVWSTQYGG